MSGAVEKYKAVFKIFESNDAEFRAVLSLFLLNVLAAELAGSFKPLLYVLLL